MRLRGFVLAAALAAATLHDVGAAPAGRPEGWSDQSYYLTMRDGVRVAVSLYFPDGASPSTKAPVMLVQTRYGRAGMWSYGAPWLKRGYVVAAVDTRGSTASFGPRLGEITPAEQADMDELIAHLAAQPWSNGQVIASGVSYMADTADMATSRPAPALKAAIPRQTDFDAYAHLFFPGGVSNAYMLREWGGATRELDRGRDGRGRGLDCVVKVSDCAALFPTLQPVDGDQDFTLARSAMAQRPHWGPETYADADFRDDKGALGFGLFEASPGSKTAAIRREAKPVQYWGSWMDAGTAEAALARFRSAPEVPTEVWITANDHNHTVGADPFHPEAKTPTPPVAAQQSLNIDFADRARSGKPIVRSINYYVLGAGVMRTTPVWPPAGVKATAFALDAGRRLTAGKVRAGEDRHEVDASTTTGKMTRWTTNFGVAPAYPDRREQDAKLATWDSQPMPEAMELVGHPVLSINLATTARDGVVFAYLEDVAPNGRSTYLTEGQLRLVNRRPADPASLPYDQGPAPHSFRRADALPVRPGEEMAVSFALFPVAARIDKGHRLRLAIGGGDADTFRRYVDGEEIFTIRRGGADQSRIEAPLRPWRD